MKKYLKFMAFAMVAVFSLAFVSCGDDDDESTSGNSVYVGTWSIQDGDDDYFEYMQLKADGSYINVQQDDDYAKGYHVSYGDWSVSNDKMILHITSGPLKGSTFSYTIVKSEKDRLILSMWGFTSTCIRVSDDTIQKYL